LAGYGENLVCPYFYTIMRYLCLLLLLAATYLTALAGPPTPLFDDIYRQETDLQLILGNQRLRVTVEKQSGRWLSLLADGGGFRGELLTTAPIGVTGTAAGPPAVDMLVANAAIGSTFGTTYLRHAYAIDRDRRGATLSVTVGTGPFDKTINRFAYELTTTYRLMPGQAHLERSAEVLRNATEAGSGTLRQHLEGFRFDVPGIRLGETVDCRFTIPGPFWGTAMVRPGTPYDSLAQKKLTFHNAPDLGLGLLLLTNLTNNRTVASYVETGGEVAYTNAIEGNGERATLRHHNLRAYYLSPGQTVASDVHHLVLADSPAGAMQTYRQMLAQTMPIDPKTPGWVREQVILEVYPKYFKGGLPELTARLPFYKSVGFTMIYLMPHWEGGYSPLDLYNVDSRFGKANDLKTLVKTAHALGLKVIFDMVIHGFNTESNVPRQRPDMFVRKEDGRLGLHPTWGSITPDWANPGYQQYMIDLVLHDQREYGNDGYRVDAAAYKGAGWNPNVPYPAYRDGSAAPELLKKMLAALRRNNPDAVLLSEVFGPVFYTVCNFVHDNQTEAVPLLQRRMAVGTYTADDYKQHLAGVFSSLPVGANRVFYTRNHDTSWFDTFDGYDGRYMAFEAVHALFGIPEIFAGDPDHLPAPDDANGYVYALYKRLFAFRKQWPEFIGGSVDLGRISSSNPQVFSGLRGVASRSSVVLANFSNEPQTATITLPTATATQTLTDIYGNTNVPIKPAGTSLTITLKPFQVLAGRL
jgi:glycosidase